MPTGFVRGDAIVDLAAGRDDDVVDVLVADHAAPRVVERLRGHRMIAIEGGTQALRRTVHARLQIDDARVTTISVPSPYAAVVLKAAEHRSDPRDRVRHLEDAVVPVVRHRRSARRPRTGGRIRPFAAAVAGGSPRRRPPSLASRARAVAVGWRDGAAHPDELTERRGAIRATS